MRLEAFEFWRRPAVFWCKQHSWPAFLSDRCWLWWCSNKCEQSGTYLSLHQLKLTIIYLKEALNYSLLPGSSHNRPHTVWLSLQRRCLIIMNTCYGHSDGKRNPTCLWRHLLADRELYFCTISELNGFKVLEVVTFSSILSSEYWPQSKQ